MDKQTPPPPPPNADRIDEAMLVDKQANGYWTRAKASAMAAQLQQNGRDS